MCAKNMVPQYAVQFLKPRFFPLWHTPQDQKAMKQFYSVVIALCDVPGWGLFSTQASLPTDPPPGWGEDSL